MRSLLVTLTLGLAGGAFLAAMAWADAKQAIPPPLGAELMRSRAKLRVSAGSDPDTVYIGHVNTNTGAPGTAGGFGPHHIGRGGHNLVGGSKFGTALSMSGTWDWDRFADATDASDSLQGWWPVNAPFGSIGPTDFDDIRRPFFCLDYGNIGCYAPVGNSHKTFGVTGYWHADGGSGQAPVVSGDPSAADHNPIGLSWAPIAGTKSAWCGLRSHGDIAVSDPITGNAYNSDVMRYQAVNSAAQFTPVRIDPGTDANFPGYGSQWDQMLYKDISVTGATTVNLTFKYRTSMDTRFDGRHASQAGWFDKDPIKNAAANDGNFISEAAGTALGLDVVDSFMVYVGAPVNDAAVTFSDGTTGTVYDANRRWFSEVVKINTPGTTYKEILSVAGTNAATTFSQAVAIPAGMVAGGKTRLVFRVKTNRGFDDEDNGANGFSSGTAGAAIIDDVAASGTGVTAFNVGFESAGDIDNTNASAFHSTGKPVGNWAHVENIQTAGLPFDDPCGSVDAAVRFCNMYGNVIVLANKDNADKPGGDFGSNTQDQQKEIASPTINLKSSGAGSYNAMGIDAEIASRTLQVTYDYLANVYNYPVTGNGFRYRFQAYPSTQPNGVRTWGQRMETGFFNFGTSPGCFLDTGDATFGIIHPAVDGLVHTSNANGIPDSITVYIQAMSRCFATNLTGLECSPISGAHSGGYYDNISFAFIAQPPPPGLSVDIWHWYNDAFPTNSQLKPVNAFGLAYDTLAANVRSAFNTAPQQPGTDLTGPAARENIPGDTMLVIASGPNVRMDLVFRILPGVGNYVQVGNRNSGVARRPDTVPRVAAATTDVSLTNHADRFWGAYMADNGAYGTGGNGVTGPGHTGGVWDPNRWNSARADTVEVNFFPITGLFGSGATDQLTPGSYMSAYHEADPKYTVLGINKNRCFFAKVKKPVKLSASLITCGQTINGVPFPPDGTNSSPNYLVAASGLTASENGLAIGHTYEFTKIIPDGQLTPGAQIQYFWRKSTVGNTVAFEMDPDTNFIFPNDGGSYSDFHRWRTVAILPDRWKDSGFGGDGMACMLVLDSGSRRGDLGTFIAMADSMGLTHVAKRGAHNGWRARPDQDIVAVNVGSDNSICRRDNGGQAGTWFDVFSTIAGESNVPAGRAGSRAANHITAGGTLTTNKWSTNGPSADMANNYHIINVLASDLGPETYGPLPNQTDDDIGLFQNFMLLTGGTHTFIIDGYQTGEGLTADHPAFMTTYLKASLRTGDYRSISGNGNNFPDLIVQPPVSGGSSYTYGVVSFCFLNNDVFTPDVTAPPAQAGAFYENVGGGGPYVAAVYGPAGGSRPFNSLYQGWTTGFFGGMGTSGTLLNVGTRKYMQDLFNNITPIAVCGGSLGQAVDVGDSPMRGSFVNFMNLKSSNPMHAGQARIEFGIQKTDKVQVRIYDVTGRVVKTIADRVFAGGVSHVVVWDGTNDAGQKSRSGVYFYQIKTSSWTSQKKLAVLSN